MRPLTPRSPAFRKNLAFLMVLGYAAAIFSVSSGPVPPLIAGLSVPDLILHACEYAVLGLLLARWFRFETRRTGTFLLVAMPALVAGAYGATDEVHQAFVEARDASLADLWADVAGAVIGAAAYRKYLLLRAGRGRAASRLPAALATLMLAGFPAEVAEELRVGSPADQLETLAALPGRAPRQGRRPRASARETRGRRRDPVTQASPAPSFDPSGLLGKPVPLYHGIPLDRKTVVVVLDFSGSVRGPAGESGGRTVVIPR